VSVRGLLNRLVVGVFGEVAGTSLKRELGIQRRKRGSGRFARFGMDAALERLMDFDGGFYVELGANDGARASNTWYFELKRGWSGVLIEPCPHLYLACRKRRGRNNAVYCNACVDFDYDRKYVDMIYAGPMTISESLEKDIEDESAFLARGSSLLPDGESPFAFGAVAATLTGILDDADAPESIDLLSLDVEGAELAVLRGIDFQRYRFGHILVECRDLMPLQDFLGRYDYTLIDRLSHHDYLFSGREGSV